MLYIMVMLLFWLLLLPLIVRLMRRAGTNTHRTTKHTHTQHVHMAITDHASHDCKYVRMNHKAMSTMCVLELYWPSPPTAKTEVHGNLRKMTQ